MTGPNNQIQPSGLKKWLESAKHTTVNVKQFIRIAKARGLNFYGVLVFRLRYKVLPLVFKSFKLLFVGSLLGLVGVFTIKGLDKPPTGSYQELFGVLAATTGTVIAIFFH